MLIGCAAPRRHLFFHTSHFIRRSISTLPNNSYIYVHSHPQKPKAHLLTYLPTQPPNPDFAMASTTQIPPTPDSTTENPHFFGLLHNIVAEYAHQDPIVKAQAAAFASQGGAGLGSGGVLFQGQTRKGTSATDKRNRRGVTDTVGASTHSGAPAYGAGPSQSGSKPAGQGSSGAGGASAQGGMGSGGTHGFIHVSDERNPPDWGRVAWPEDIFGSLEVDAEGAFVPGDSQEDTFPGRYQRSGTYRVVTREGVLGLSPFLRGKLVERLKEVETASIKR